MANLTFEEKLAYLEKLTTEIKNPGISIEDAISKFEDGIKLADSMKNELDKIEGKIQLLMNQPSKQTAATPEVQPQLDLFSADLSNTSGAPQSGLRQF